jgi:ferredoxin-nitrate reductase
VLPRGSVRVPVQLSEAIRPGVVFLPLHWGTSQPQACEANRLMHELGCPLSKQPELKAAAVRLEAAHAPAGEAGIQPGQHLSGA